MGSQKESRQRRERLQFLQAGKIYGFRSSGLSAYNNVDPHTVIRELVQNALDAARAAEREVVRVVFDLEEIETSEIPARSQYREHLENAIESQRKMQNIEQSTSIIDTLRTSVEASPVPVLWVLDNGIGLNNEGMEKLLGDGQSAKADEATAGSYGNGHMTSFPASNLRYVVYGGVHKAGRTVSGHAILASHLHGETVCGEDGYLAEQVRANDLLDRFDFYDGSGIPVLREKLDWIEEKFGTGSAVGILGFNKFNRCRSNEKVLEVIETVVATHFAPLIHDGAMEVELRLGGAHTRTVDGDVLGQILERRKDRERRDRNAIGPSGRQAWDTLETLKPEYRHTIDTQFGKVRWHVRPLARGASGGTHVQLFKNGMWITNDVPHNKASDYRNVVPFNGVVLLEPKAAKPACGLVGRFEGPRHIYIDLTIESRASVQRKELDLFLKELHRKVLKLVPALESGEYDPGFFSIEVPGDGVQIDPRARAAGAGTPERTPRRVPGSRREEKPPLPPGPPRPPRPLGPRQPLRRRIEAQITGLQQAGGIRLRAKVLEKASNAELRVVIADGSDETCDSPAPEQYLEMGEGAKIDGRPVKGYLKDKRGGRRALLLGPVAPEAGELDIWIPCRPFGPGGIRAELVRLATRRDGA